MQVTIHNLPEASAQDVFDTIAIHLLTQMETSYSPGAGCMYRYVRPIPTDNNNKNTDDEYINANQPSKAMRQTVTLRCAAGCLIPELDYPLLNDTAGGRLEGKSWKAVVNCILAPLYGPAMNNHSDLIRDMQRIHDQFTPVTWSTRLKKLAATHNLNLDAIKKFEKENTLKKENTSET